MKTADKMFEELGYKKKKNNSNEWIVCEYYKCYEPKINSIITFWKDREFSKYDANVNGFVKMQELKAINKKCEELGWLN